MPDWFAWLRHASDPIWGYAQWRESYLRSHPEKRLFPWLFHAFDIEASEAPTYREPRPFISFTPEVEKKIGTTKWALALVAIALLASRDS